LSIPTYFVFQLEHTILGPAGGGLAGSSGRAPSQGARGPLKPKAFQLSEVERKWQICLILIGICSKARTGHGICDVFCR